LFEYLSMCVDWDRLIVPVDGDAPSTANAQPEEASTAMKEKTLQEAINLLVEGAMRSAEYKEVKKNVEPDRAGIVMFRML